MALLMFLEDSLLRALKENLLTSYPARYLMPIPSLNHTEVSRHCTVWQFVALPPGRASRSAAKWLATVVIFDGAVGLQRVSAIRSMSSFPVLLAPKVTRASLEGGLCSHYGCRTSSHCMSG